MPAHRGPSAAMQVHLAGGRRWRDRVQDRQHENRVSGRGRRLRLPPLGHGGQPRAIRRAVQWRRLRELAVPSPKDTLTAGCLLHSGIAWAPRTMLQAVVTNYRQDPPCVPSLPCLTQNAPSERQASCLLSATGRQRLHVRCIPGGLADADPGGRGHMRPRRRRHAPRNHLHRAAGAELDVHQARHPAGDRGRAGDLRHVSQRLVAARPAQWACVPYVLFDWPRPAVWPCSWVCIAAQCTVSWR
jgi:hypothetical protein